jgi:hypothetical protein
MLTKHFKNLTITLTLIWIVILLRILTIRLTIYKASSLLWILHQLILNSNWVNNSNNLNSSNSKNQVITNKMKKWTKVIISNKKRITRTNKLQKRIMKNKRINKKITSRHKYKLKMKILANRIKIIKKSKRMNKFNLLQIKLLLIFQICSKTRLRIKVTYLQHKCLNHLIASNHYNWQIQNQISLHLFHQIQVNLLHLLRKKMLNQKIKRMRRTKKKIRKIKIRRVLFRMTRRKRSRSKSKNQLTIYSL